jgi:hypothetical protein
MGQANSTGASEPRPHRRTRPTSWAPSLLNRPSPPQPESDGVPELVNVSQESSGPASGSRNPLRRLSSLRGWHDAGSSGRQDTPAAPTRPRTRLSRARSSLSSISEMLHSRPSLSTRRTEPVFRVGSPAASTAPRAVLQHGAGEPGDFLPRVHIPELDIDVDRLLRTGSTVERPDTHRPRSMAPSSPLRRDGRALSSILPPQRRLRDMINPSRRRRSMWGDEENTENIQRLRRGEDQADVLSRLLSLAAAATAASLVGEDTPAATRDGTFDTFLQSLQNGSIASALRNNEGGDDSDSAGGSQQPLNFFRMFRFGTNPDELRSTERGSRGSASGANRADGEEDGEGRMVPIIIVGIRSINPGASAGQDDGNIPPFIDALSSFPTPPTSPGDNDHILRPPQNGTRFSHRRRASMGGFNFPSNYDSQRHHRAHAQERQRPWSSFAESPSGPLPPPSTPATNFGQSAEPSGATTPATSTSPPSPTTQSAAPSRRESFVRRAATPALAPTAEEPQPHQRNPRQRRMSESDFTRYGAGAPRRRGVVEPDNNPGEGSRSWIIYVLGGSYPENHPILTTPSLFTDSPTYEDMMLLSSILGPAKPPVASEEDVASAPGLFRIRSIGGVLMAEAVDGDETINLATDARCLVCLCDFEANEEARKLVKCEHVFHKLCIDQVS